MGKPFLHPMIIHILSTAAGITDAIQRLLPHFSPEPNGPPEIPCHLLALASVAVSRPHHFDTFYCLIYLFIRLITLLTSGLLACTPLATLLLTDRKPSTRINYVRWRILPTIRIILRHITHCFGRSFNLPCELSTLVLLKLSY